MVQSAGENSRGDDMPDATPTTEKKPRKRATASDTKLKPATKKAAKATRKARRAPPRTAPARRPFDVLALRRALGHGIPVARPVLAKLLAVHVNTIANLEHGSVPSAKTRKKLEEIAAKAASGKLGIPARKKLGPKPKAVLVKPAEGIIDVAALRKRLGLSRLALAKKLGSSPTSVLNWETGTVPAGKYAAKLRALASGKGAKPGKVAVERRAPGRPRTRAVPIVDSVPIVYANVVKVTREGEHARIRFGLAVPGEKGARCVADVVVTGEAMGRIAR